MDPAFNLPLRRTVDYREEPKKDSFCVTADLLIPGKGDPIENGCIVITGTKITKVGTIAALAHEFSNLPKYHVSTYTGPYDPT